MKERAYGDSGYQGKQRDRKQSRKTKTEEDQVPDQQTSVIHQKLSKSGQYAAKKKEHQKSSVSLQSGTCLCIIKKYFFRYRKTQYRGLRKQTAKLNMMFALANLYLAENLWQSDSMYLLMKIECFSTHSAFGLGAFAVGDDYAVLP